MMTKSERFRAEAKEVSRDLRDLKEVGGIAKDAAREQFGHVRETAAEYYEQGQDKVRSATGAFEQCVRERPVVSLVIAAGVGLLFGRFCLRR